MTTRTLRNLLPLALLAAPLTAAADGTPPPPLKEQDPNTWGKRSPTKDGPVSPGMGSEPPLGYDPVARRVLGYGGHNQGGGAEQNAELWALDPATMKWELKEP